MTYISASPCCGGAPPACHCLWRSSLLIEGALPAAPAPAPAMAPLAAAPASAETGTQVAQAEGKLGERLPPGALGDFGAMKSGRKWLENGP